MNALEVFGASGDSHTLDYVNLVRDLTVWELDSRHEPALRRNLPSAHIQITDSYVEATRTSESFELIVVGNPMGVFANHCEHFDLFPSLFPLASDKVVIVLNVIPSAAPRYRKRYAHLFTSEHLECRRSFYGSSHPEDIAIAEMIPAYAAIAATAGFQLDWSFSRRRALVHYLVLCLHRTAEGVVG